METRINALKKIKSTKIPRIFCRTPDACFIYNRLISDARKNKVDRLNEKQGAFRANNFLKVLPKYS